MAWKCVVTNAGAALLANYAQGDHTLYIDGATVASGIMDEINLRVATALTDEKDYAFIINKIAVTNGTKFKIQVGPAAPAIGAYTAHQIGLWAYLDDGPRTLLALAQDAAGGVGIPLQSVSPAFAFALYITVAVTNTGSIVVNIDEGAFVTNETLVEGLALKVDKADVVNDLTTTEAGKVLDARQGKALNEAISLKANAADVYTKSEVDTALDVKADASSVYTKAEVDDAVGAKASRHVFNATIPVTGWEAYQSAIYRVTVNVPGFLASDACGGSGPVQTGTETDDKAIRKAWGKITRIVAGDGSITVYAKSIPDTAIPIEIEVFR